MFLTIKEFWLKWRLRVAEKRVLINTKVRRELIESHAKQVAKVERIKTKLETL